MNYELIIHLYFKDVNNIVEISLFLSVVLLKRRQIPSVMCREEADQDGDGHADQGRGDVRESCVPANVENNGARDGGDSVDTAAHDERHLACHDVAEDSAANAGDDGHEDGQEAVIVAGGKATLIADDDKGGKTYCVGCVEGVVGVAGIETAVRFPLLHRVHDDKGDEGGHEGHKDVGGIQEHARRCDAQQEVSDDTSPARSGAAKDNGPEEVHAALCGHLDAGDGKGDGADHFEEVDERVEGEVGHNKKSLCILPYSMLDYNTLRRQTADRRIEYAGIAQLVAQLIRNQ